MSLSFQKHSTNLSGMRPQKMNLVALMDIFTILIFFLMLNFNPDETRAMPEVDVPQSQTTDISDAEWALILEKDNWSIRPWKEGALLSNQAAPFSGNFAKNWQSTLQSTLSKLPAAQKKLSENNTKIKPKMNSTSQETKLVVVADKNLAFETINPVLEICHSAGLAAVTLAVSSNSN